MREAASWPTFNETAAKPFCSLGEDRRKRLGFKICGVDSTEPPTEVIMTTIARALSYVSDADVQTEILKTIAIFCSAGLFVSLLVASYGLDLSPGFF